MSCLTLRSIRPRLVALSGLAAFIALGSACGVVGNNGVERIAPPGALLATVPSSTDPTTSEAATSTSGAATTAVAVQTEPVRLYFIASGHLTYVATPLASPVSLEQILAALQAGPPVGALGQGLRTAVPAAATNADGLHAENTNAGVAIVDLPRHFFDSIAVSDQRLVIAQIVLTLTDSRGIGQVTFDVDERGEVGLLTRNIKIQASEDAAQSYKGGHIMAMVTSKMFVEGVELNRMGQHMELARYPIHWHLDGDAKGQYIRNASIHDTYNRCVTVHGTHNLRVENNVTYNTVGHCFFLEDGIEHGNQFVHNLAIQTKCHTSKPCVPRTAKSASFGPLRSCRVISLVPPAPRLTMPKLPETTDLLENSTISLIPSCPGLGVEPTWPTL